MPWNSSVRNRLQPQTLIPWDAGTSKPMYVGLRQVGLLVIQKPVSHYPWEQGFPGPACLPVIDSSEF